MARVQQFREPRKWSICHSARTAYFQALRAAETRGVAQSRRPMGAGRRGPACSRAMVGRKTVQYIGIKL
ncbi:hypothetical protein RA20_17925 [Leisingera sp. ANG-Vp]|nr:hypothetical protein RA20_17925 [Leisingera sp. ANG-Vp]